MQLFKSDCVFRAEQLKTFEKPLTTLKPIDINTKLVEKCLLGDRIAQYDLYNQYSKAMYNVCLRMVNETNLAEDMLQESFVQVFKHLKAYKFQSTLGAWIKRIVVNNCINYLRKKKIQFAEMNDQKYDYIEDQASSSFVDHSFSVDDIKNAVRLLPEGYKLIFNLYAIEGYDHEEISQILDISISTSKSQYSRAKKKIQEMIKSSYEA